MNETWRTYGVLQLLETVHWARTIFQIQLRNYCLQIIFLHHCVNAILNKTSYINLYQDQNQGWWIVLFSNHKTNSRPVFTCYISLQQKHQTFIHCTFLSVCSFQNTEQVQWHIHTHNHTRTQYREMYFNDRDQWKEHFVKGVGMLKNWLGIKLWTLRGSWQIQEIWAGTWAPENWYIV